MLYGWIEVGASNNSIFSNTNNDDIIIRTIQTSNKILLGNTENAGTHAAVYITGNNVGIRKIPESNVCLDVHGFTRLHTCQIGLSNLPTYVTIQGYIQMKDTSQSFDVVSSDAILFNSNGSFNISFQNKDVSRVTLTNGNGMIFNDTMTVTKDVFAPAFNLLSDRSIKCDIVQTDEECDVQIHKHINVVNYRIKEPSECMNHDDTNLITNQKIVKGFIAQDVEKTFPTAVKTNETNGLKTIDMSQIIALNTSVIQNLMKRIEVLEKYMGGNK